MRHNSMIMENGALASDISSLMLDTRRTGRDYPAATGGGEGAAEGWYIKWYISNVR